MSDPRAVERVEIALVKDLCPPRPGGFLSLHELEVRSVFNDGSASPSYRYEAVLRTPLDAVVVVLTAHVDGEIAVCLRSCARPPAVMRTLCDLPQVQSDETGVLWEVPAGLIESSDRGLEGLKRRAAAETCEETGYFLPTDAFSPMRGAPMYPSSGTLPERLFFMEARVTDVGSRQTPQGDGSHAEAGAVVRWVTLEDAVAMCDDGAIADMKTELAIRRLAMGRSR